MQPFIYLASPHSHDDPQVREMRAVVAAKMVYVAMLGGVQVSETETVLKNPIYSPIAAFHWAHLAMGTFKAPSFTRYAEHDFTMINNSAGLALLPVRDNFKSVGVQSEMAFCSATRKPIMVLDCRRDFITSDQPFAIREFNSVGFSSLEHSWEELDSICSNFIGAETFGAK